MLWERLAWIFFLHGIHKTLSGEPPVIRYFLTYDLTLPGDVPSEAGFHLPCKASGTNPLEYRWQHNGRDIVYGDQYRLLKSGALEGFDLDHTNNGTYQCFAKNDFGEDFSRKLKILVTVAGAFYYENDKVAPVNIGEPIEIPCPSHEPSFGVKYRWGSFAGTSTFHPLVEDKRIAVTLDGTLVIMQVTREDVKKVTDMGGIMCEMSTASETKYSHFVDFTVLKNESTGFLILSIYFAPKPQEEARVGYVKELYCLAVAMSEPNIIWRKDGEVIVHGEDGFYLPSKYFNRLLIIDKVTHEHQGYYSCTAYAASGLLHIGKVSKTTFLTVKASPKWKVELSSNTSVARSETTSLVCLATGEPKPRYSWFRNGRKIETSGLRVKLQDNTLKLTNVKSWHEAVFQCVAENDQGMIVTSTWVNVREPPTIDPNSQGGISQKLLWIIITAVVGVLLIVSIIVIVVCYKRRKVRRERPRAREEASHYNDIFDDSNSNSSLPNTSHSGATNGIKRRPALPPVPQYQTLDPSTAGIPSYEPLDPEQDLNDSGLYEKLDFRNNGPEYDNPDKPIPEYLELVDDTNVTPGTTAPSTKTREPGKQYYEPMEGDLCGDVLNDSSSSPSYVPMEMEAPNVKSTSPTSPSSPKYYEPMTGKLEPNAGYYQPMKDKAGLRKQGEPGSPPPEYYVPMAEQSLNEPVVQISKTPPECSEDIEDINTSKL